MRPFKEWPTVRWLREHRAVVDVAIALIIAAVSTIIHFAQDEVDGYVYRDPTWWTVPLVAAAALPLIWRRSHAILTAFVVFALQAGIELLEINGPSWIPMAFAFYALGAYAHGPTRIRALTILGTAVSVFLGLGLLEDRDDFTIWVALAAAVWLVAVFVVGDNMRRRRAELAELAERADRAERERELLADRRVTEERTRIARELHDIVAHSVSVMVIQASAARRNLQRDRGAAEALLGNIEDTGRRTMGELRQILGVLREAGDGGSGAIAPMVPMLCDLDSLASSIPDLDVRLHRTGSLDAVPIGIALAAYRVVQEALTNAHRHGGPNVVVEVQVACGEERVDVRVSDDGRGASTRATDHGGGYGIIGMSERVAAFGGTLSTGPRRTGGWEVRASFPLQPSPTIRDLVSPVREFVS
jgi:signal transduction histidine kinase